MNQPISILFVILRTPPTRTRHHLQVESILTTCNGNNSNPSSPLRQPILPRIAVAHYDRNYGIQNRYPRFHHHCSPLPAAGAAQRARPEGRDQAKPRAHGAFNPTITTMVWQARAPGRTFRRHVKADRRQRGQILGTVMVAALGGAGFYFGMP